MSSTEAIAHFFSDFDCQVLKLVLPGVLRRQDLQECDHMLKIGKGGGWYFGDYRPITLINTVTYLGQDIDRGVCNQLPRVW